MGLPRTTRPRSVGGLSPRHTASFSSEMPGGGGVTPSANALVLPELEAITLSLDGPAFVTPSRAARARSGTVTP